MTAVAASAADMAVAARLVLGCIVLLWWGACAVPASARPRWGGPGCGGEAVPDLSAHDMGMSRARPWSTHGNRPNHTRRTRDGRRSAGRPARIGPRRTLRAGQLTSNAPCLPAPAEKRAAPSPASARDTRPCRNSTRGRFLQPLGLQHREPVVPYAGRREGRDLRGEPLGGGARPADRGHPVDQTHGVRLGRCDRTPRQDQVHRPGGADQPRQPYRPPSIRGTPQRRQNTPSTASSSATRRSHQRASSRPPATA